jgi:hypothetical protein
VIAIKHEVQNPAAQIMVTSQPTKEHLSNTRTKEEILMR